MQPKVRQVLTVSANRRGARNQLGLRLNQLNGFGHLASCVAWLEPFLFALLSPMRFVHKPRCTDGDFESKFADVQTIYQKLGLTHKAKLCEPFSARHRKPATPSQASKGLS